MERFAVSGSERGRGAPTQEMAKAEEVDLRMTLETIEEKCLAFL